MLWHGERCNLREATLPFFNQNAACPSTLLIVRSSTRVSLANPSTLHVGPKPYLDLDPE